MPRIKRNCELGRLTPTGPLPGSEISSCEGAGGQIEKDVIKEMELDDVNWFIEKIPRLSTKGTRRALVTNYSDFHVDTVPIVNDDTLGKSGLMVHLKTVVGILKVHVLDSDSHYPQVVMQPLYCENLCSAR